MPLPKYLKCIIVRNEDTGDESSFSTYAEARHMLVHLLSLGYLAVMFTDKTF